MAGRHRTHGASADGLGIARASAPSTLTHGDPTVLSQSLPQLPIVAETANASLTSNGNDAGAHGGPCRGAFCRVRKFDLPGLYGHAVRKSKSCGEEDATAGIAHDSGQRVKIGNNHVLLAKAEMTFLRGVEPDEDEKADGEYQQDHGDTPERGVDALEARETRRALRWQEADNVHRMELGRGNPHAFYKQVAVCPNCQRVYADLAALRDAGFQRKRSLLQPPSSRNARREGSRLRDSAWQGGDVARRQHEGSVGGNGQRHVTGSGDQQDESDYDQLFLAELAKHSGGNDDTAMHTPRTAFEAEHQKDSLTEPVNMRSNSSRSEHEPSEGLPRLRSPPTVRSLVHGSGMLAKKKKKTRGSTDSGSSIVTASSRIIGVDPGRSRRAPTKALDDPANNNNNNNSHNNSNNSTNGGGGESTHNNSEARALVTRLRDELTRATEGMAAAEARCRELEAESHQSQAKWKALLQDREEDHRRRVLELELEVVNKSKPSLGGCSSDGASGSPSTTVTTASTGADVAALIETIDALNAQLDDAHREQDGARQLLVTTHQSEIRRLHDKYQRELDTLRLSEYTAKEHLETAQAQTQQAQREAQVAMAQARSARAALDELSQQQLPSLEQKNRALEKQLAELQQQQQQKQHQLSGGKMAPATATNALVAAATESSMAVAAVEKRLGNKVEYLKAQLASEMKCKEELGHHLAQLTASLETLKKDKKAALSEQEEVHRRHLERVQAQHAQEQELATQQQAALQGKVASLQANVTDLVQDLAVGKQREANAQLAMDKMGEESVRLTRQLVDLEAQVEALTEERQRYANGGGGGGGAVSAKNANDETSRMQMEALLRRLDNERQYLKNQLEQEVSDKEAALLQLSTLQRELAEERHATQEMTTIADQELRALKATLRQQERHAKDQAQALEEGKHLLTQQLAAQQLRATQLREQALVDKDELEKMRLQLEQAREQVVHTQQEAAKDKAYAKAASERMAQALATIKTTLKTQDEDKSVRIQRLEQENALFLEQLASAQGELQVKLQQFAEERAHAKKTQYAWRLALHWRAHRQRQQQVSVAQAMTHWRVRAVVDELSQRQRVAQDEALALAEDRLRGEYMDKCDDMTQELHAERVEALQSLQLEHDRARADWQRRLEQEHSQVVTELKHVHAEAIQVMAQERERMQLAMEEQCMAAVTALQQQCDALQQKLEATQEELTTSEAQGQQARAAMSTSAADWHKLELEWRAEKEAMLRAFDEREQEGEAAMEQALQCERDMHASAMETLKIARDAQEQEALAHAGREHGDQMEMAKAEWLAQQEQALRVLAGKHADEIEQEKAHLNQHWQHELTAAKTTHEAALKEALARVEARAQSLADTQQREWNDRKATALMQCTAKWQRALEEQQARVESEKKVAYEAGVQAREQEWQRAALQIKERQREELDRVQQEALRAVQAAEQRHALLIEAQDTRLRGELGQQQEKELQEQRQRLEHEAHARYTTEVTRRLAQLRDELNEAHREEIANLRREWREDFESDLAQREQELEHDTLQRLRELRHWLEEEQCAMLMEDTRMKLLVKVEQLQEQHALALQEQQEQIEQHWLDRARDREQDMAAELAQQLEQLESRLLREQEDAIQQVQDDSERLLEQVEAAMVDLKKQKEVLEQELLRLRTALETAEDAQFDLEQAQTREKKRTAFHVLALLLQTRGALRKADSEHRSVLQEGDKRYEQLCEQHALAKTQVEAHVSAVATTWKSVTTCHEEMRATLTSYRRDELVAHRSASAVVSQEVAIVTKQMEEVTEMKRALEEEIAQLHGEAQRVENELRQVVLQGSSSSTGAPSLYSGSGSSGSSHDSGASMNMAIVAKKRRLNEEFEALLEHVERKKNEVRNTDKTLASLRARRDEKEAELKAMERQLVEILVGQQKQMLTLLNGVRELTLPAMAT